MRRNEIIFLKSFMLYLFIPLSALAQETRKVAVFDPAGTVEKALLEIVREEISSVVVNTTRYTVLERQLINKVLEENLFQESGLVNDEQVSDIGRRMGADYVFVTAISPLGRNYYISCKMIEVATARIDKQFTGTTTDGINDIPQTTQYIVRRLFGENVQQPVANRQNQQTDRPIQSATPQRESERLTSESIVGNQDAIYLGGMELIFVEGRVGGMKSFYIGKYEVTQRQWENIMGRNPSKYKGPYLPVHKVSYNDVLDFIRSLNKRTGLNFSLPTPDEWLYAARGGKNQDDYAYAGSNDHKLVAVYNSKGPQNVGTKRPNSIGIYDMSGNVWEWVTGRKLRGGGWSGIKGIKGITKKYSPKKRDERFGFRVVLTE